MERELKLGLVDPGGLNALLALLPTPTKVIEQRNHYFIDEAGRLKETRTMVRVRVSRRLDIDEAPQVILTTKRRLEAKEGYFIAQEAECALASSDWELVQEGRSHLLDLHPEPLASFNLTSPLICHGIMRNVRHVVDLEGFTLEIDRSEFPGNHIAVEVEVETDDPEGARALVTRVANDADVALFPQERGKYARFLAALSR